MRRLFLLATFLTLVLTARAYTLNEGEVWWGHYLEGMPTQWIGAERSKVYNVAMFVPGDEGPQREAVIGAIRFQLAQKSSNLTNVRVWLSSTLPATADDADLALVKVQSGALRQGDNDVKLTAPVTLPNEGLWVGLNFRMKAANTPGEAQPISVTPLDAPASATCLYQEDDNTWSDLSDLYALTLQLAISGPGLQPLSAQPLRFTNVITTPDTPVELSLELLNSGTQPITELDAHLLIDGQAQPSCHFAFSQPLGSFRTARCTFSCQSAHTPGSQMVQLMVTRINGTDVQPTPSDVLGVIALLSRQGHRRVLMEEYTGTWCSWCPRGMAGIQLLEQTYGDDFIAIAVHGGDDPMVLPAYTYMPNHGSYPSSMIDRTLLTDPYGENGTFTAVHLVEEQFTRRLTEADLELTAAIDPDDSTRVELEVATTFHFSAPYSTEYALALVITADSLTAPTWVQSNIYSGMQSWANSPGMEPYVNGPGYLVGMAYNHVPVAVQGIDQGIQGSIATTLSCDEAQHYATQLSLADCELPLRLGQLHAVAMLIYRPTGEVINAARTHVDYSEPAAISTLTLPTSSVGYTLDGRLIHATRSASGLFIRQGQKVYRSGR